MIDWYTPNVFSFFSLSIRTLDWTHTIRVYYTQNFTRLQSYFQYFVNLCRQSTFAFLAYLFFCCCNFAFSTQVLILFICSYVVQAHKIVEANHCPTSLNCNLFNIVSSLAQQILLITTTIFIHTPIKKKRIWNEFTWKFEKQFNIGKTVVFLRKSHKSMIIMTFIATLWNIHKGNDYFWRFRSDTVSLTPQEPKNSGYSKFSNLLGSTYTNTQYNQEEESIFLCSRTKMDLYRK